MADYMSAREAWVLVREGDPAKNPGGCDGWESALYARACAIVAALVHAHEGLDEAGDYDVPLRTAMVRALERGDEIPKVNVRALERGE